MMNSSVSYEDSSGGGGQGTRQLVAFFHYSKLLIMMLFIYIFNLLKLFGKNNLKHSVAVGIVCLQVVFEL